MSFILIIDPDPKEHSILSRLLSQYRTESAFSALEAETLMQEVSPDLILLETELRDTDGCALLRKMQKDPDSSPVIVVSSCTKAPCIVNAMKAGAFDYITKPYNAEELLTSVRNCIASRCIQDYAVSDEEAHLEKIIIGSSEPIRRLRKKVAMYAETELPVLISGESGSGKELVARSLHILSNRQVEKYRIVHCGAIPPTLFESELYGSESGAYTGAVRRAGYFEQADGGSLFLDEIGELPLEGQVKLLRILEDREIIRVGGQRPVSINVRILSATNRDLSEYAKTGKFRTDLFYRINTLHIQVPPLRTHLSDIPLLCRAIMAEQADQSGSLSRAAVRKLMEHQWPGNVRELRNVLLRAYVTARGETIEPYHLSF